MKNKLIDIGVVVIFASTIAMTIQKSFDFGYGIATGIVIVWIGLIKRKN